jgi:hypothetical protein
MRVMKNRSRTCAEYVAALGIHTTGELPRWMVAVVILPVLRFLRLRVVCCVVNREISVVGQVEL